MDKLLENTGRWSRMLPLLRLCLPVPPTTLRTPRGPVLANTDSPGKMPLSYNSYSDIVSEVGGLQMKTMKVREVHRLGKVMRPGCGGDRDQDPGTDSCSVGLPHTVPPGPGRQRG